eukprot:1020401-Amphidinium_carterae.1
MLAVIFGTQHAQCAMCECHFHLRQLLGWSPAGSWDVRPKGQRSNPSNGARQFRSCRGPTHARTCAYIHSHNAPAKIKAKTKRNQTKEEPRELGCGPARQSANQDPFFEKLQTVKGRSDDEKR